MKHNQHGHWDAADGIRESERPRINRTIPSADRQDHFTVPPELTLEPFEFLAKYFSLTALVTARDKAIASGQDQAATLFRKALDRTTRVGGRRL